MRVQDTTPTSAVRFNLAGEQPDVPANRFQDYAAHALAYGGGPAPQDHVHNLAVTEERLQLHWHGVVPVEPLQQLVT